jgi:hypothetical protein
MCRLILSRHRPVKIAHPPLPLVRLARRRRIPTTLIRQLLASRGLIRKLLVRRGTTRRTPTTIQHTTHITTTTTIIIAIAMPVGLFALRKIQISVVKQPDFFSRWLKAVLQLCLYSIFFPAFCLFAILVGIGNCNRFILLYHCYFNTLMIYFLFLFLLLWKISLSDLL